MTYKYIRGTVPEEVIDALHENIDREDLENADNFRYSPLDDSEGLDEFDEIEEDGCCGSASWIIIDAMGREWVVGCNYGH